MGRLLGCVIIAACYHPAPGEGVQCADNGHCPSGQQCDPLTNTCVTHLLDAAVDAADDDAPVSQTIAPGALIVPMDAPFQDKGQLEAFGLVYALLQAGIGVDWIVAPDKAPGDPDLTTDAMIADHATGMIIAGPVSYAGGPFAIAAADRAVAEPIVNAYLAAHPMVAVHDVVSGMGGATVARHLVVAPSIALFGDAADTVAFTYLNAAHIPDGAGIAWGSASADVLTEAALAGATTTDHTDGALFDANHAPKYRVVVAMHYGPATAATPEVAAELRAWLADAHSSAVFECLAAGTLENAGHYLTTAGVTINSAATGSTTAVVVDVPADLHAQFVGTWAPTGGALASVSLPAGSTLVPGAATLIHDAATPANLLVLTGHLDGDPAHGQVSYLGGHSYPTTQPISTNPGTNGARLFLDGIFASAATSP